MIDIDTLEALVGPLPKGRATFDFTKNKRFGDPEAARQAADYWRGANGQWLAYDEPALAEAYAVIKRLAGDLTEARFFADGWHKQFRRANKARHAERARAEKAEAGLREVRHDVTLAYRLWLQRHYGEMGELLEPHSTDFARHDAEHGGEE